MRKAAATFCAIGLLLLRGCGPAPTQFAATLRVTKLPPVWPQAHPITCACGAYQAQAVLRAHGKVVPISNLYVTDWARSSCSTLPWDIPILLRRFGDLKVKTHYDFGDAAFASLLKGSLERHDPLIVLIQATRGHYGLHWISVWGYSAKDKSLLVYDSQYPVRIGGVGNAHYSISFLESRFPWWTRVAVEVED